MTLAEKFRVLATVLAASALWAGEAAAECGKASWYRGGSHKVAGEKLPKDAMTAAHRTLPLGSRVEVRNTKNGRTVIVHITDRGPFIRGRIIDVSKKASEVLEMDGVAKVCITEIKAEVK